MRTLSEERNEAHVLARELTAAGIAVRAPRPVCAAWGDAPPERLAGLAAEVFRWHK